MPAYFDKAGWVKIFKRNLPAAVPYKNLIALVSELIIPIPTPVTE